MIQRALSWLLIVAACLSAGLLASPAAAHLTPNSEIRLTPEQDFILADIIVPRGEYAYGTDNPIDGGPQSLDVARRYLLSHFAVTDSSGKAWQVSIRKVEFVKIEGPPDLHAIAVLTPPPGVDARTLVIDWHVLIDSLPNHFALFVLDGGSQGERTILGAVRTGSAPLKVVIADEGALSALSSAVSLGVHHILGGYDHLMFLLALLLPAPLLAQSGRWRGQRSVREAVVKLAQIVTAFTIGHSLTLVGATLGHWNLPTAPVEIAIAVSVLISAIHAARPLLPGREPIVALLFGLVHGLAFATLIQRAGAGTASGAVSLFGFNLGIEMAQLAIVAAVAPSLLILSRFVLYKRLREVLAALCAAAATAWILNRSTGALGGFVTAMETVMSYAGFAVLALAAFALLQWIRSRAENRSEPAPGHV
ncbi:MAG: HupE/UreJ family protein [Croceibacterium sp.]